jgi:beta-aspartyl-peptidase (threonine type)
MWAIIGTWPFALEGVELAAGFLQDGGDAIEAVVRAIEPAEKNPRVDSVGPGGLLNIEGELELDAGIMDGRTLAIHPHRAGCDGALQA